MHDFAAKTLPITHSLAMRAPNFCLIITFLIKHVLELAPALSPLSHLPETPKLFAPLGTEVPSLDPQDEVVEYDAAADPHNRPEMFLVCVDLNAKLEQRLKPAFQQANCVFNADTDL